MSQLGFKCLILDKVELWKQYVTVTSVAVATTKFPFGMCDRMVDKDAGTHHFSLVRGILHVCGHANVRSHESLGMD